MNSAEQHQKFDFDIHEEEMVNSVEGFLEDIGQGEEAKQNPKVGLKKADSASFSIDSDQGIPDGSEEAREQHFKAPPAPPEPTQPNLDFGELNYLLGTPPPAHVAKQKSESPSVPQLTHQESEASSSVQIVEDPIESPVVVPNLEDPKPADLNAHHIDIKQAPPSRIQKFQSQKEMVGDRTEHLEMKPPNL